MELAIWFFSQHWVVFPQRDMRDEVGPGDGGQEVSDLPHHEGEGEQGEGGHLALLQHGGLHVAPRQTDEKRIW